MSNKPMSRFRIALNVSLLNDLDRMAIIAGIQKVAPTSALMKVPSVAASYSALITKTAALQTNNAQVSADRKQLELDESARDTSRAVADAELVTLKTLVGQNAQSPSDVSSMGFSVLAPLVKTQQAKPDVPGPVVVLPGKELARARVGIQQTGRLAYLTVAEVSADPPTSTSWSLLPGSGKQRKLVGYASGTRLWVRFAAVRYGQMSDWSTPVLVTIP